METFVNVAQQLTIDKNGKNALDPDFDPDNIDVYGVNISKWWAGYMPFLFSEGGDYLTEDGKSIGYATAEGKDVLQKLADLTYVYHVAPTPTASETMPGLSEALATNKVAMSFDGQWSNASLMSDGVEYNVAALPKMGETPATVATYGAIALMNTEKTDAAFEFVKYIMTEVGACEPLSAQESVLLGKGERTSLHCIYGNLGDRFYPGYLPGRPSGDSKSLL